MEDFPKKRLTSGDIGVNTTWKVNPLTLRHLVQINDGHPIEDI